MLIVLFCNNPCFCSKKKCMEKTYYDIIYYIENQREKLETIGACTKIVLKLSDPSGVLKRRQLWKIEEYF